MPVASLQEISGGTRLSGFGNLLRKELGTWWSGWRWLWHGVMWLMIMNGLPASMYLLGRSMPQTGLSDVPQLVTVFFGVGGMACALGAVVMTQDAVIGERQTGTAAWILSKPVGRSAFVLAKFLAVGVTLLVLAVAVQAPVALGLLALVTGAPPAVAPFLLGAGMVGLSMLFYVALTLMLGTLFQTRGPVLAGALGVLFGGQMLLDLAPWLVWVTPLRLTDFGTALALGMPLSDLPPGPVATTAGWILVCLAVALRRFAQEEM